MYAQVYTYTDIAFVVSVLGRYLSDPSQSHWKATEKVLRYLQGTKDLMLTYWRTDTLEVVGFSDSDYAVCVDNKKSTFGYIFIWLKELFRGKLSSKYLQLFLLWRQSMWRIMRLLVIQYSCGTSFQLWRLFTQFLDY